MRRLISHWIAGFAISIGCVGSVGASDLYLLPGDTRRMVRRVALFVTRLSLVGWFEYLRAQSPPGAVD